MKVKELMTPTVVAVLADRPVLEACRLMRDANVGFLAVCDSERLRGVLTDRDVATRAIAAELDPRTTPVSAVMTPDPVACFADDDLENAARIMRTRGVRRLPVLGREEGLVGVLSLGDFARSRSAEELVGGVLEGAAARHSERPAR